jgi:hypothetical protein
VTYQVDCQDSVGKRGYYGESAQKLCVMHLPLAAGSVPRASVPSLWVAGCVTCTCSALPMMWTLPPVHHLHASRPSLQGTIWWTCPAALSSSHTRDRWVRVGGGGLWSGGAGWQGASCARYAQVRGGTVNSPLTVVNGHPQKLEAHMWG